MSPRTDAALDAAAALLRSADGLLIGAGAGMGVDSGLPDFRGDHGFWRAYPPLAAAGIQVLHTAGRGKSVPFAGEQPPGYLVVEYLDRMDLAYAAADAVVCRSGAGNVSEVTALGLPAAERHSVPAWREQEAQT